VITYTNYTNLDSHYDRPYEPGDRLVRGWHEDAITADPALAPDNIVCYAEAIFVRHNADDRPDGQLCPSLSVGDVIVIGEVAFSVARVGFVSVELNPADLITDQTWKEAISC
jgi:hypothetical protein